MQNLGLNPLQKCIFCLFGGFIEWKTSVYFCPLFTFFKTLLTLLTYSALDGKSSSSPGAIVECWNYGELNKESMLLSQLWTGGWSKANFSKCLPVRMQSHIGYIYLTFLHCVFSNVSSNPLPVGMQNNIGCIYLTFHAVHFQMSLRSACQWGWKVTLVALVCLCVFKWFLKLPACKDAKSHRLHLFGFSRPCVCKCLFKLAGADEAKKMETENTLIKRLLTYHKIKSSEVSLLKMLLQKNMDNASSWK